MNELAKDWENCLEISNSEASDYFDQFDFGEEIVSREGFRPTF